MTNAEFKMMSLGKQGLFVHEHFDEYELRRYINYLIQTIQMECRSMQLHDITLDMANNLMEIVYDNDELFEIHALGKEVKK